MEEQKLCYNCREYFSAYSMSGLVNYLHCHCPEPEEKPSKCWCEREGEKRLQVHDYITVVDQWNLGHYQMRAVEIAKYCPNCGKRLKEKKEECWWCREWLAFEKDYKGMTTYEVVKKLIGLNAEAPECPICSRKHREAI